MSQHHPQQNTREISLPIMSQRGCQQENGETSSTMSEREHQQENGSIKNLDTEKQSGGQDNPKIVKWHAIFIVSFGIAILCVDPLFLFLPVINQKGKCLTLDRRLMITAIFFRLVFDMIYVGNIIFGYFSRRNGQAGLEQHDRQPRQIIKRYLRTYFPIDILAILPLPQVLVPITVTKMGPNSNFLDIRKVINFFVLLQYVPRVLRIYLSWKKHIKSSSNKLYTGVWIKIAFNIFFYILASHVLGGLWYFFSIQRETTCWHNAWANGSIYIPGSFKCDRNSPGNYTWLDHDCPINPQNATLFDFGIFKNALDSGIVSSTSTIPQKIMFCFWWGLRNLSSLGQNLETSNDFWENCFAIFIAIYGLILVLYFIGNAQTFMQMATEEAATNAKRLKDIKPEVELWMARNNLPPNMKEPIIRCILKENKDFDKDKLISHLSKDLVTKIKHHLCLPLLKNAIQNLKNQGDQNLLAKRICESLKLKYYDENLEIIKEGKPVNAMVFITKGSVWCLKTSSDENGEGANHDHESIDKFELYGEKLLEGLNHSPSHKEELPIITSTKTVKTHSNVETFTLTADDLKPLVPMRTRGADRATKVFPKGVFWRKENRNENSPKMSEQNGTSSLLDGAPKSC